jgi:DNA-binding CsgD family transcriptional regulator
MIYSRSTLSVFSNAIGAIYSCSEIKPEEIRVRPSTSAEQPADLAYLEELLATHRQIVAQTRRLETGKSSHDSKNAAHNFTRLRAAGLTARETEIIFWIAEGKRDAEIATIIGCASKTVSKHVENILAKLGAETRLAAVHAARDWLSGNP